MVDQCEDLLNKAKRYNTQQLIDGHRNVWILKPGGKSRGRGTYIFSISNLDHSISLTTSCLSVLLGYSIVIIIIYRYTVFR